MKPTKLVAEKFLSWNRLDFDFTTGVTLINGTLGAGKSAVVNALCFVLYGKIPKDVNIDDVIKHGEKSCTVYADFDEGFRIVRTRNPNNLYIDYLDRPHQAKGKDAKETQKMIDELVGMSFTTFCHAIYFAQNSGTRFITASEDEKGKILSELLELNVFDKGRANVRLKLNDANVELIGAKRNIERHSSDIESLGHHLQSLTKFRIDFSRTKAQQEKSLIDKLDKWKAELDIREQQLAEFADISPEKKAELQKELKAIEDELKALWQQEAERGALALVATEKRNRLHLLRLQESNIDDRCPECGQKIPMTEEGQAHREEYRAKCKEEMTTLEAFVSEFDKTNTAEIRTRIERFARLKEKKQAEYYEFTTGISRKTTLVRDINILKNDIGGATEELKDITARAAAELKDTQESILEIEKKLLKARDNYTQTLATISLREVEINRLEMLKDGFKEVKQYVFQNILVMLTKKANDYLDKLVDVPVQVSFNNQDETGEISKIKVNIKYDGADRSYGLLSGGQAKQVEIATSLALSDLVRSRSNKPWDLRIFDEPFQNLDEPSMQKCIFLFEQLQGITILIEHNTLAKSIVTNTFDIEYRNGESVHNDSRIHEQEGPASQMGIVRQG